MAWAVSGSAARRRVDECILRGPIVESKDEDVGRKYFHLSLLERTQDSLNLPS